MKISRSVLAMLFLLGGSLLCGWAQGTTFTYQGSLAEGGSPADGSYDFTFALFDDVLAGTQQGATITTNAVEVANGLFTVALDFGNEFSGSERWLEISVAPNGETILIPLAPRQPVTSTPYAIEAVNASAVSMGTITDPSFIGTTTTAPLRFSVNNEVALQLESTSGTPNIIAGHVNNNVADGTEGATILGGGSSGEKENAIGNDSDYSAIGGGLNNSITGTSRASVIGGGENNIATGTHGVIGGGVGNVNSGWGATLGGGNSNKIWANDATIGGGVGNQIHPNSRYSTVSGGVFNNVFGPTWIAVIGGGQENSIGIESSRSTIAGGFQNTIADGAKGSTIGGGWSHKISTNAQYSFVGGGVNNVIGMSSTNGVITGGIDNTIASNVLAAAISGGATNQIGSGANNASVGGGTLNSIYEDSRNATIGGGSQNSILESAEESTIGGGRTNSISTNAYSATISGGYSNDIGVNAYRSVIGGGAFNGISSKESTIGGGRNNNISTSSSSATISGGYSNDIGMNSYQSVIGGGINNNISSNSHSATISGGLVNQVSTNSYLATIGGGSGNDIGGNSPYSVVPGGNRNKIGEGARYAFAAGRKASANHPGAFVWGDSQDVVTESNLPDQMTFRAQNGLRMTEDAGGTKPIFIGERYRDNAILAWGKVGSNGDLLADFGVVTVTYLGTGKYEVRLNATPDTIHSLIPVAIAEIDGAPVGAAAARIVSINQNPVSPFKFEVYINNGNYALVDNDFVFMVTAR